MAMDTERKLATIRRITGIDAIDGADQIVCVTVDGWKLVSAKANGFNVGDLVIYFEIDSFLPCIPQFEWMRDRCYKNTSNLGEGFRVRTIKLRGTLSQGLIVAVKDLFEIIERDGKHYLNIPEQSNCGDTNEPNLSTEESNQQQVLYRED
jgi:RNA ligase (TIGR02306 family)